MSKIAQYLNEHILGEATSAESIRKRFSRDDSVLSIMPELVVHPRVTNDIRKVARFSWQLAEKGHVLSLTVRGGGSDQTGASIGKGVIINTPTHLNSIIYIAKDKEKFVHVQPGVTFKSLNDTLQFQGLTIPAYMSSEVYGTVGGSIANNNGGSSLGRLGFIGDYVSRLEVVLANGDLIETSRISRKELDHKKGLQTFEGEIYRKIDGIIEDNEQLIKDRIADNTQDNAGYPGIAKVKQRDGSFDLTPLIVGSQGTLGIISEAVLKTEFYSSEEAIIVAVFESSEAARDAADILLNHQPNVLDVIDGSLFDAAKKRGKKYLFESPDPKSKTSTVVFASFNDFSDGARKRKMKRSLKDLSKFDANILTSDNHSIDELRAISEVDSVILSPEVKTESTPPLISGSAIPTDRREEFIGALEELGKKHHLALPFRIQWISGIIQIYPTLDLHRVGDKQKVFKLIADYIEIVIKYGGDMCAASGEGRLKTAAVYEQMDKDVLQVYADIRNAFDPFGTLNPGVKQESDLKTLIAALNSDYRP